MADENYENNVFFGDINQNYKDVTELKSNVRLNMDEDGKVTKPDYRIPGREEAWTINKNILGGRNGPDNESIANINGGKIFSRPKKQDEQIYNKIYDLENNKLEVREGNIVDTAEENKAWIIDKQNVLSIRNAGNEQ